MQKEPLPQDLISSRITCEPPRDASHGDVATNAAMVLCKPCGMKPRDLAGILAAEFEKIENVDSVEIAGPGLYQYAPRPNFLA